MLKTKILLIRFSSIGDIVLTTPVIRCIKQQWEGEVEVHFLTKKSFGPILLANPYIQKIHTINSSVDEVIEELKSQNYDYVVDLHNNIRSLLVKKQLKSLSFTIKKLNIQKWIFTTFKWNFMPNKHIVDRYMATLKAFGIENDGEGLDYFIPLEDEVDITVHYPKMNKTYTGLAIGGSYATKKLPFHKLLQICNGLSSPILLLGGIEDKEVAEKLVESSVNKNIFNACGLWNINQSASLVKQASKMITHDTGLMHIAAAFKKDTVSVWGNTVPSFGMTPYLAGENSKIVEVNNLSCRPCSKLGYQKCPKGHFKCMEDISVEEITNH
jgi:ADP-heptose:LPS heptosyltransferase